MSGIAALQGTNAANLHELAAEPALAARTRGLLLGDRNYWAPGLADEMRQRDLHLLAPFLWASRDPRPHARKRINHFRYRIDMVFGQLVERCLVKRVWAHDTWHLCSRLSRKVLMHTLAVFLNLARGNPPLHLARLVA